MTFAITTIFLCLGIAMICLRRCSLVTVLPVVMVLLVGAGCGDRSVSVYPDPAAAAAIAPDATEPGKLAVSSAEFYKFAAYCDDSILPCSMTAPEPPDQTRFIELWAQVFRPARLDAAKYPLVVMLHGNHGTCGKPATDDDRQYYGMPTGSVFHVDEELQYTLDGTCADGESVVASHLGFSYLAERLAGNGYVVVSINANRGITAGDGSKGDEALIFARARLVLAHLKLLSDWNSGDASRMPPNMEGLSLPQVLQGKLDFSNVGLFGHSRGGEGVRAAYVLYLDGDPAPGALDWKARIPGMSIKGIFEVGPTDYGREGLSGPPLAPAGGVDADGTAWTVLLPMCDGDVEDLQGVRPFDRMMMSRGNAHEKASPALKATYSVWGTNHNYFNTEWQTADSEGCIGPNHNALFPPATGSSAQTAAGLSGVMAFFRGVLATGRAGGYRPDAIKNFDPAFGLPATVTGADMVQGPLPTRVDRGFSSSSSAQWPIEDFTGETGTSERAVPHDVPNIEITHLSGQPIGDMVCPEPLLPLKYIPNHDQAQRAASIAWSRGGADVYFQVNLAKSASAGFDTAAISEFGAAKALEFRVARRVVIPPPDMDEDGKCSLLTPLKTDPLNKEAITSFSIRLEGTDGTLSGPVNLQDYMAGANLAGPVGMLTYVMPEIYPILQTVRVALSDFPGSDAILHKLKGVRFTFDRTASGAIYLANIRFGKNATAPIVQTAAPSAQVSVNSRAQATASRTLKTRKNPSKASITAIRHVASLSALNGASGVEIEISSDQAFQIRNAMLKLYAGGKSISISRHPNGDMTRVVFTLDENEYASIPDGSVALVRYGGSPPELAVQVGKIAKPR